MKKNEMNGLTYYVFEDEPFCKVMHGFFTRNGGVSPAPWNTLNLSTTGGDTRENVIENRNRIFKVIGKPIESLYDTWQVHGTRILETESPRGLENEPIKADGIITKNPNVTLFMRFADCVPLVFSDKKSEIAGIAHAGWKGTLDGIASKMVGLMVRDYGLKPEDICVGIGPCISAKHYNIKEDVFEKAKNIFPDDWGKFIQKQGSDINLDLSLANKIMLENSGVKNIVQSGVCTASSLGEWFSHRAEHGRTGRFAAFISPGQLCQNR
jgi:YfiH family protein